MSSAKAALESDTQVLAWEAGRKYGIRVNTISAGMNLVELGVWPRALLFWRCGCKVANEGPQLEARPCLLSSFRLRKPTRCYKAANSGFHAVWDALVRAAKWRTLCSVSSIFYLITDYHMTFSPCVTVGTAMK
jgi:NAD(P)-dependent dehydrogenase (short-subunit alcohol dehydrogenase family)